MTPAQRSSRDAATPLRPSRTFEYDLAASGIPERYFFAPKELTTKDADAMSEYLLKTVRLTNVLQRKRIRRERYLRMMARRKTK